MIYFVNMKALRFILVICTPLLLSSCVEIIDDLTLNNDGSGTFKYNINLSSSKVKINSILALDSLDGRKVPSIDEIKAQVARIIEEFDAQKGISAVSIEADYDEYMFKLKCDFETLAQLQAAIKNVVKTELKNKDYPELEHNWVSYSQNTLQRSIPQITIKQSKEINQKEIDLLKLGTYTSITRFEREIESFENNSATLSKNKKAIMLRTDPYSLTQNPEILDNSITLTKKAE